MIQQPLAWTLLTVSLWISGLSEIMEQKPSNIVYPRILSNESIDCDCANIACDSVYWFRSASHHSELRFLGKCNNADQVTYGDGVDKARFKLSKKRLHIISVTEEDAGIYSCVFKDRKSTIEMWKSGTLLQPGGTPPTLPPKTKPKPPVKSVCHCSKKKSSQDGCGSLVLWPLVGLISALALALICTLYYFSRLPKKCQHHFAKKRQMT